jgi:hypothetical protein
MKPSTDPGPPTVKASGADAGRVLCGATRNNRGLRLLLAQARRPGKDGAITGGLVTPDAGANKHAPAQAALLHRPTDARRSWRPSAAPAPAASASSTRTAWFWSRRPPQAASRAPRWRAQAGRPPAR